LAETDNNSGIPGPRDAEQNEAAAQAAIRAAVAALTARSEVKKPSPQDQAADGVSAGDASGGVADRASMRGEFARGAAGGGASARDAVGGADHDAAVSVVAEDPVGEVADGLIDDATGRRRVSVLSVAIGANAVLLVAVALIVMKIVTTPPPAQSSTTPPYVVAVVKPPPDSATDDTEPDFVWSATSAGRSASSLSWERAEKDYRAGRFADARDQYTPLVRQWQALPGDGLVCDFLQLRLANCLIQVNDIQAGRSLYQITSQSRSPAVRASSLYQLAAVALLEGQYLRARSLAMQALTASSAAESSALGNFQSRCDHLAARAVTEKAVLLWGGQWAPPWRDIPQADPFAGLDEKKLRTLLSQGSAGELPLTPRVSRVESTGAALFSVRCSRAPLEDVLAKIALASDMEVRWENVPASVRQRPVTLSLPAVNSSRAVELACGVAGLMGRCVGTRVEVADPDAFAEQSRQRRVLATEAQAAWRRYVLRYGGDRHAAEALYAAAGMSEALDESAVAVNEYQMVVNGHRRSPVAPQALYRCAYLRLGLKEYAQARRDLTELLELFPDYAALDQVELSLGEATMEEGLHREALKIFERVYFRQSSVSAQASSALSAGLCYQRLGRHEEAVAWIGRFLQADSKPAPATLAAAEVALARSFVALDKPSTAVGCLQEALRVGGGETMLTVETALLLAEVQLGRGRYGGALSALALLSNYELTEPQNFRYVLLTVSAYGQSGLTDKALAFARGRLELVHDVRQVARIQVELARGYRQSGDLEQAGRLLTTWLPKLPPEQSVAASVELAEICLALGKPLQSAALLEELVADITDAPLRGRAASVLGRAYMALDRPEKAAAVYAQLGQISSLAAAGGRL